MHSNPFSSVGYDISELRRLIEQKADRHEIYPLTSAVDRLERSLREIGSTIDGLRHRCERLEENLRLRGLHVE